MDGIMSRSGTAGAPKLLDQVRELLRIRHYSIRTEQAYLQWIKRFILFHGKRHPRDMGAEELTRFLSDLAIRRNVSASTQNQALNAILFLYRDVLKIQLPWLDDVQRAKKPQHLPVVFTREEVRALLAQLDGTLWLMAMLTYGAGLRLLECLRLRVKDIDFQYQQILIRDAKGQKDRITVLPTTLVEPLRTHLLKSSSFTNQTLARVTETCICHSRSQRSIPAPTANGAGSTSSRRREGPWTRDQGLNAGIMHRKTLCSARSSARFGRPESRRPRSRESCRWLASGSHYASRAPLMLDATRRAGRNLAGESS